MNILIIGTTDILGGAAKVSWNIRSALLASGHTVSMFVADKRSNDLNVKIIPRTTWRKYVAFLLADESYIDTDWLLETKEFKKADIIHCHNLHGRFFNLETLQKMSLIKPVIWTLHDEWAVTPHCAYTLEGTDIKNGLYVCPSIDVPPRILWNNSASLSRWKTSIYEGSKLHIITPSIWLKERVLKTPLGKQDIRHIPNGIDTSVFFRKDKEGARMKLGLPKDKKIILFLANDAKNNTWKGWKYTEKVIEGFKDRDDIIFLSVGNHEIHRDETNIKYVGHIEDKQQLSLYYNSADALLFTSIAENFPLVILEAMGCGLPIITFDVGGIKEVVNHKENGYIASYLNTEDLVSGVRWFLSLNKKNITEMSEKSSNKICTQYDITKMIEKYISLYNELHKKD
jgi:glycosyltransferase involved in cell wall biosynthesis